METTPKIYQELPDEILLEHVAIAEIIFTPEQLVKLSFYKEALRREL